MGYDKAVRKSLEGRANVYFPEENCRFASFVLRYMHEYGNLVNDGKVDVLHWNAGLWDCLRLFEEDPHTPIDVYGYYIDRICSCIRKLFPEQAHSDAVHYYTPVGTQAFANEVLSHIIPPLGITEKILYREELYTDKPIGI